MRALRLPSRFTPPGPPPGVPPESTPLDPTGDDMDAELEESGPPHAKRRSEFGTMGVPSSKQEFQQWSAGLDREALAHCQALNEQHEREEHAQRSSSCCVAVETDSQCG